MFIEKVFNKTQINALFGALKCVCVKQKMYLGGKR